MIGMQELLEAEKQHRDGHEVACNHRKSLRHTLAPRFSEARCQRKGATTEGRFAQHERQPKAISRMP